MSDCIFCKIVNSELPSYKVYEDDEFLAFLDIFPVKEGQTIVVLKEHYPSKFSSAPEDIFLKLMKITQKVAKNIEEKLPNVERCQLVIEGFHTDHLHAKLFPAFMPDPSKDAVVHMGEKATDEKLQEVLEKVKM